MDHMTAALAPIWETPLAVLNVLGVAQAGTLLFALFLFVAALEVLRSGSGLIAYAARAVALFAATIAGASFFYGDFLAPPAKAALSLIAEKLPGAHQQSALYASLGLATVGVAVAAGPGVGRNSRPTRSPRASGRDSYASTRWRSASSAPRLSAASASLVLGPIERLQLRQLTHNPKKAPTRTVRPARYIGGPGRQWS